jgi:CelD/BcsL family acetyltransferase involved in cellulose biosynthesis
VQHLGQAGTPISQTAADSTPVELLEGQLPAGLLQEWDELVERGRILPWLGPGWMVPWWQHMGRTAPVVAVLRSTRGELQAVLPLRRAQGVLASPTDWHTPEFDVAAQDAQARRALLEGALHRSRGRLTMDFVPADLAHELAHVARAQRGRSYQRVLESSPYLPLTGDWEARLSPHLLAELRRRERRLAERGDIAVEVHDGTQHLDHLLDEAFRVEASGWKGRQGTAILCRTETRDFYRAVGRWAAERGLLRLAFLRLDGRPLAVDIGIQHNDVFYLLKNGYDEAERAAGPGKQLRLAALRHFASQGVTSYEFLGDALAWKQEWTPFLKDRYQVHAFRVGVVGSREWALHAQVLPTARRIRDSAGAAGAAQVLQRSLALVRRP